MTEAQNRCPSRSSCATVVQAVRSPGPPPRSRSAATRSSRSRPARTRSSRGRLRRAARTAPAAGPATHRGRSPKARRPRERRPRRGTVARLPRRRRRRSGAIPRRRIRRRCESCVCWRLRGGCSCFRVPVGGGRIDDLTAPDDRTYRFPDQRELRTRQANVRSAIPRLRPPSARGSQAARPTREEAIFAPRPNARANGLPGRRRRTRSGPGAGVPSAGHDGVATRRRRRGRSPVRPRLQPCLRALADRHGRPPRPSRSSSRSVCGNIAPTGATPDGPAGPRRRRRGTWAAAWRAREQLLGLGSRRAGAAATRRRTSPGRVV